MYTLHHIVLKAREREEIVCRREEGYFTTFLFLYFYTAMRIRVDGEYVLCPPGTVILYEPDRPQFWMPDRSHTMHDYFDFSVNDRDYMDGFRIPYNTPIYLENPKRLFALLTELKQTFDGADHLRLYRIDDLMIRFFAELSDHLHKSTSGVKAFTASVAQKFDEVRTAMYAHPEGYDTESYCKALGFSHSRAAYYYRTFYRMTLGEDINRAKKMKAERIVTADTKLSELCELLSYESEEAVSRWFRRNFGVNFSEYKERLK